MNQQCCEEKEKEAIQWYDYLLTAPWKCSHYRSSVYRLAYEVYITLNWRFIFLSDLWNSPPIVLRFHCLLTWIYIRRDHVCCVMCFCSLAICVSMHKAHGVNDILGHIVENRICLSILWTLYFASSFRRRYFVVVFCLAGEPIVWLSHYSKQLPDRNQDVARVTKGRSNNNFWVAFKDAPLSFFCTLTSVPTS